MGAKDRRSRARGGAQDPENGYSLPWPTSDRWNPNYNVPRNSFESWSDRNGSRLEQGRGPIQQLKKSDAAKSMSWGRSTRDMDTATGRRRDSPDHVDDPEEFSNLTHWLETLAELHMNELDNRARWDPRWLNITRRERFEGLSSASVTIIDYPTEGTARSTDPISNKRRLATMLQDRPEDSEVRVIIVNDLSRFIMGALGQIYSIDPEFWFEHLANSGYGASDSGLKIKNAVWMNWQERETRFRHRALPDAGQRTEWNVPRRTRTRCWAHLRWPRLGLLNYLGRKGFHEDEMGQRLGDGRWVMERDVRLDKYGRLITKKREAEAEKKARKKKEKKRKDRHLPAPKVEDDGSTGRSKSSNVYRPYAPFIPLPRNPGYWKNRDLRVLAPEGASYWSKVDDKGKKTIILLLDPTRNMQHDTTREVTPSLTFMPRAMEFESYTWDELWRTADPDETYLDPPPPPPTKKEMKQRKRKERQEKLERRKKALEQKIHGNHGDQLKDVESDNDSDSSFEEDSDYDEEYEENLRQEYRNPKPINRDRDFARKYSLSTSQLLCRYMTKLSAAELRKDDSAVPSLLCRLYLDDFWQLLSELRMGLDHIDGDLGADLHMYLIDSIGTVIRQNVGWMRSTLQELGEWSGHLAAVSSILGNPPELDTELKELNAELEKLQSRTEQTLNLIIATTTLSQSTLVIDQTSGINKLTELAFFFVPLSFITSVFSMQVLELTESPPRIWTWGVALAVVFLVTYIIRSVVRSPSLREFAMTCRVTMLNRFTSNQSHSSSRRLNAVGNRAIVKFILFFTSVVTLIMGVVILAIGFFVMILGGLWLAAAAVCVYFIVTRWPELEVVIPCFICIAISALGMAASWYWSEEIGDWVLEWCFKGLYWVRDLFPARWTLDTVDDEDLAKEGVETYARQAVMLATA